MWTGNLKHGNEMSGGGNWISASQFVVSPIHCLWLICVLSPDIWWLFLGTQTKEPHTTEVWGKYQRPPYMYTAEHRQLLLHSACRYTLPNL